MPSAESESPCSAMAPAVAVATLYYLPSEYHVPPSVAPCDLLLSWELLRAEDSADSASDTRRQR